MSRAHPYLPNSVPKIKRKMMDEIGVKSIDDLYVNIPEKLRFKGELQVPGPYTEQEVKKLVSATLEKSTHLKCPPFLGGGVWPHYVPSVVDEVVRRAEFLTSYTPYQPEISQGILQAIFEYQSLICELVEMAVANASMYDWSSALGEAALLAKRLNHRDVILVPSYISPSRLAVLKTYTSPTGMRVEKVNYDSTTGMMDLEDLKVKAGEKTAAVYVETPSYLGFSEENVDAIGEIAHENKALYIAGVDPISLGVLKAPGSYDVDVVVGEGQPLGNHMSYGGPLLGIFACNHDNAIIRQMPGRIIGITETIADKRRAYVMTLQTREQHIRREKATSNICSNQALCSVASAVYLSLLGPNGLRDLAETCTSKANYSMHRINDLPGVKAPIFNAYHFKEFTVKYEKKKASEVNKVLLAHGYQGGKPLKPDFPELGESALFCVTEMHTKEDIDGLVTALKEATQ
ncbi:glycine dehydrogenase (aminomethyl-transferring) [Candidatus Bathyarchaeota archaeon RBG_13_52_12]|nr:MAG: glycine dehydrogenase (aminomethyl-transferring) [Candidatus Bathyarchaeota archaeon RBG_13_52_12]